MTVLATLLCALATLAKDELPYPGDETFETTVKSATWLSFDISPDGETFVLEVLGDLFTLLVEGGTAEALSTGIAFDSQPVYSPDGSKIAFISDRSGSENVWLMDSDGKNPRKLSSARKDAEMMSPSWSPDGSHVIVSVGSWEHRTYSIWAYHLDGGKGLTLAATSKGSATNSHNHVGATYSPDSKYLYFAFKEGGFGYNLSLPLWQIQRLELETSKKVTITDAVGSAFRPVLSPDGTQLVYGTRFNTKTGLRLRDLESGEDRWLSYPVQRDEQESRYTRDLLPAAVFHPLGNNVYYTRNGKIESINLVTGEEKVIEFEIPLKLNLESRMYYPYRVGMGPVKAQLIRGSSLPPDGKQLAFSAIARIHLHDLEKGQHIELSPADMFATQPSWSPNSKQIAFVDWQDGGGHIWRVRAKKGAKPQVVTQQAGYYFDPVWSPDGKFIYALRASGFERSVIPADFGQGVGTDLVRVSVSSGETTLVTHAPSFYQPHFGPEADRIYVYEYPGKFREGASGLISMRLDGSDSRKHMSLTGPGIYNSKSGLPASQMRISPDGQFILAEQASQLYILKLLGQRGATIKTKVTDCSIPCERLTDIGVDEFGFDLANQEVYWTIGHSLFRRPLSTMFEKEDLESKSQTEKDESNDTEPTKDADSSEKPKKKPNPLAEEHDSVQENEIPVYYPRRVAEDALVLRNASILTMEGDEPELLAGVDLHIENGRIHAIGEDLKVSEASGSLDLTGKFVLPGYVDTHAHIPLMRRVTGGQPWALAANLAYGVTTVFDVQPSTVDILEYEDLVDAGVIVGPRVLSTGPGVFSDTTLKSKRDAVAILKRYRQHYGVRNTKTYLVGNREQRQWIVQASKELEMNSTTEGALDMKLGLTYALDGFTGLEHALPVIGLYDDVKQLFARTRIAYTPTLLVSYGGPFGENYFFIEENPRDDPKLARFIPPALLDTLLLRRPWFHHDVHVFQRHAQQALEIVRAGGQVGVGSHGQLNGLGFHWELWALSMGGFSNFEALRAATRQGAEMIGIDQDVGSVREGKLADLVILNTNPLDDIRSTTDIHAVVSHGIVRDGETLAERWPKTEEAQLPDWELVPN